MLREGVGVKKFQELEAQYGASAVGINWEYTEEHGPQKWPSPVRSQVPWQQPLSSYGLVDLT
jgi:hypothetical protein